MGARLDTGDRHGLAPTAILLTALALAAALLVAGCGGGDDETSTAAAAGSTAAPAADSSCLESFTSTAPETLPRLASLSHAPDAPVLVGTYAGEPFEAEIYDETTTGDGTDAAVEPGACVVTEVSPDFGPLYLFVEGDDGAWHRLLESDRAVPLVPDPEAGMDGVEEVEIEQIGG